MIMIRKMTIIIIRTMMIIIMRSKRTRRSTKEEQIGTVLVDLTRLSV